MATTLISPEQSEMLKPPINEIYICGPAMLDVNITVKEDQLQKLAQDFGGEPIKEGENYFIDSPEKLQHVLKVFTGRENIPADDILDLVAQGNIPNATTRAGGTLINAIHVMPPEVRANVTAITTIGARSDGKTDKISDRFVKGLQETAGAKHLSGAEIDNATGSVCFCVTVEGHTERTMFTFIGAGRDLHTRNASGEKIPFPAEIVPIDAIFQFELYELCLGGGRGKPDYADFIESVLTRNTNFTVMGLSTPWINEEHNVTIKRIIEAGKINAIVGNREEFVSLTGKPLEQEEDIKKEISALMNEHKVRIVIITLGKDGLLIGMNGQIHKIPGSPDLQVTNTTGAGDSITGGLLAWLAKGGRTLLENHQITDDIIEQVGNYCKLLAEQRITTPPGEVFLAN